MNVRELITELLQYNLDATVSINGLYEESENIHMSWIASDSNDTNESKKHCEHLFLETDYKNEEQIFKEI